MDLHKLKATRAGNRAAVTRIFKRLEASVKSETREMDEIQDLLDAINKKKIILQKLDEEVLTATETENIEKEVIDTDEYDLELDSEMRNLKKLLNVTINPQNSSANLNSRAPEFVTQNSFHMPLPSQQMSQTNSNATSNSQNHRLPKLSLPKFSGDILEWQTFWDSFETTVHINHTLTDV